MRETPVLNPAKHKHVACPGNTSDLSRRRTQPRRYGLNWFDSHQLIYRPAARTLEHADGRTRSIELARLLTPRATRTPSGAAIAAVASGQLALTRIVFRSGIPLALALVFATCASGSGYGRLLAQSKVSTDSDGRTGYIEFTRLAAGPRVYTLVYSGPTGKLFANGDIGCASGQSIHVRQGEITMRPYVRSFRARGGSGACRADADANISRVAPSGRLVIVAATIRLYGR